MLWLNFAPLLSLVEQKFSVSENLAGLLLLVFPLIFVFLSFPAGKIIDQKGYRFALVWGSAVMAIFAGGRIFTDNFYGLLLCQIGIALAQPFVMNAISKLVLDWFDEEEATVATGLGTMGMFIGMAAGLALTPLWVEKYGFQGSMIVNFLLSGLAWLLCFLLLRENSHPHLTVTQQSGKTKILMSQKEFQKLTFLSFAGMGFFNGLTTWLEPILIPNGLSATQVGIIGAIIIIGGIIGSIIVPWLAEFKKTRKPFLVLSGLGVLITLIPFSHNHDYFSVASLGFAQGFFFLPALALMLDWGGQMAGEELAGTAAGILMLAGNIGAVVVIIMMQVVRGDSPTFEPAIIFLMGLMTLTLLVSALLKEKKAINP